MASLENINPQSYAPENATLNTQTATTAASPHVDADTDIGTNPDINLDINPNDINPNDIGISPSMDIGIDANNQDINMDANNQNINMDAHGNTDADMLEVESPTHLASPEAEEEEEYDTTALLSEAARLATFDDWPHARPSREIIAAAGFYFADGDAAADEVACPSCARAYSHLADKDVFTVLSHERGCELKGKLGETKNRSCVECHELFASVGSKLNHCKRAHPRPEEERRLKKMEREARALARGPAPASARRVTKIRAGGGGGRGRGGSSSRAGKRRAAAVAASVLGEDEGAAESDGGGEEEVAAGAEAERPELIHGLNGISYSGKLIINVDCEPSAHETGEIVMTRPEYRELREHFRASLGIFKLLDTGYRGH